MLTKLDSVARVQIWEIIRSHPRIAALCSVMHGAAPSLGRLGFLAALCLLSTCGGNGIDPVPQSVGTARLTLSPASLAFGNVRVGKVTILPVVLTNSGNTLITISQATVAGEGFSIGGSNLPSTLTAGQTASFSVSFAPSRPGAAAGSISFVSNALNSPAAESLSGTGMNAHSVSLSWSPSTSGHLIGYNIYCSTLSHGPYTRLNPTPVAVTTYTDTTVQAGQTYYYVTSAVDSQHVESAFSNQVEARVPSP